MNFLAHLYLSKNHDDLMIGNFIADAVKGNRHKDFDSGIQAGILLHRFIDSFTDEHPIVRRSKRRLNSRYKHYNGVIIDIIYDHFLAKNWLNYAEVPLNEYAETTYAFLMKQIDSFPEKIQFMLPYMVKNNWLIMYASIEGIGRILNGMNRRTDGKSQMNLAVEDLRLHYADFEKDFSTFFEELKSAVDHQINTLKK